MLSNANRNFFKTCLKKTHCALVSTKARKRQKARESTEYEVHSGSSWEGLQAFAFGFSATGALGLKHMIIPQNENSPLRWGTHNPTRLSDLKNPIQVACGYGFTVYISKFSHSRYFIYGCGLNSDGQLGQHSGISADLNVGRLVHVLPAPEPITLPLTSDEAKSYYPSHIACGRAHTVIGMHAHSEAYPPFLFTLGNNTFGQCGRSVVEGERYGPETGAISRITLPEGCSGIKQLCCGQDHSLLLATDGTVYSTGLGTDGQLGQGHFEPADRFAPVRKGLDGIQIGQLTSSGDTVLALSKCGRLFAWGNNEYGQIWPCDDTLQVAEPVELPLDKCIVPSEAGSSFAGLKIGQVQSIACAGSMCCVVDNVGHVFVWGFGCLGLGPQNNTAPIPTLIPPGLFIPAQPDSPGRIVSVTAGLHHLIARSADGQLWAWGAPRGGIYCLGLGLQMTDGDRQTYPCAIRLPGHAHSVACGVDHTVALVKSLS